MSEVLTADAPVQVLSPMGRPPTISRKGLAPRLDRLEGHSLYLVDCRFDDSVELLRQIEQWFAEHMPAVDVKLVQLASTYGRDDPELWRSIQSDGGAAILGVGHCSTCAPAVATHGVTLENDYRVPVVTLHTSMFQRVVRSVTQVAGLPELACVYVPQPVMGKSEAELRLYVEGDDPTTGHPVMEEIINALTRADASGEDGSDEPVFASLAWGDFASEEEAQAFFIANRLTDMLPIVVPTPARVAEMLAHTSHAPDVIVGRMQPTQNRGAWSYTVKDVAVNAVMSGAKPEYFPVILALAASQVSARSSSSSSAAVMAVVNGPIRHEISMNCGIGALGPFNHANATIGRAYGLLSQNLQGGSVPGESYMGSLGNGYGYNNLTFAENEERSPWEPLHVQHGFAPADSTVSIFSGCRSTTFNLGLRERYWRQHVQDMLVGLDALTPPTLLLDPIAARQFVDRGGFTEKAGLIAFVQETLRMPAEQYWDLQLIQNYVYPRATNGEEPFASRLKARADELISIHEPSDINVVVVGGETNGYWQIMGCHLAKTVSIDEWR